MFVKVSKAHNKNRYVGFIEPSECRMGGEILQLLRVLRLRDPICEAVNSKVFLETKKFHFIGRLLRKESFWEFLFAICKAFYPLFRLLRLTDTRIGGIDKVKYYIMQVDRLLKPGLEQILELWKKPSSPHWDILMAAGKAIDKGERPSTAGLKTSGMDPADVADGELISFLCVICSFWVLLNLYFPPNLFYRSIRLRQR
jgi:hypothetical protein